MKKLILLGLVFVLLFSFSVSADLTTDLVSYYKFDGDADDSVGSNDGTVTGATNSASYGKINQAYSFDGTNDVITISDDNSFHSDSFSLSIWVKFNGLVKSIVWWKDISGTYNGDWQLILNKFGNNKLIFQFQDGSGDTYLYSDNAMSTGTWYHVVVTSTGSSTKLYIDNTLHDSSTTSWTQSSNTNTMAFGAESSGGKWLNGIIDEPAIWSRALTSTEVSSLYNSGSGFQYPFTTSTGWQGIFLGVTDPGTAMGVSSSNINNILGVE